MITEDDVGARAGDVRGVFGGQAENADRLAGNIDDGVRLDQAGQGHLGRGVDVRAEHREVGRFDEIRQGGRAGVELMVADGRGLVAQGVHEVGRFLALPVVEEEGALEVVAGIDQQHVAAFSPNLLNDCGAAGNATQVAVAAGSGAGLYVGVRVVGVQDRQGEVVGGCLLFRTDWNKHGYDQQHGKDHAHSQPQRSVGSSLRLHQILL